MILALLACSLPHFSPDPADCDPRVMAAGEVRVRRIPCSEEQIVGGEARVGDYLLENAVARFAVRGVYAPLTELEEDGGTLVDAAVPGGTDLLMELIPYGDRSSITMVTEDGLVGLDLPGVQYRLAADSPVLEINSSEATFQQRPGVERVGATLRAGDNFVGANGDEVLDEGGRARILGPQRVSVSRDALWDGEPQSGDADADTVLVSRDGAPLLRLPVSDGKWEATLPTDVSLLGEREGCAYAGLTQTACGSLKLRLVDPTGEALSGQVTDGQKTWRIPKGGGLLAVGPEPRMLQIWGGPAFSQAALSFPGGDAQRVVTLQREISGEQRALAVLDVEGAPDWDTDEDAWDALNLLGGAGVDDAVVLADDEVPGVPMNLRDAPWAQAGSRAGGLVWSWPWVATAKKAAHGAVPWQGRSALDLLNLSRGRSSDRRITVVTTAWVLQALAEKAPRDWDPKPDALFLNGLADVPLLATLLDQWVDISPVGPYTWLEVDSTYNLPAFDHAITEGHVVAGNGPALRLQVAPGPEAGLLSVMVTVEAPRWMGMQTVGLATSAGEIEAAPDALGRAVFRVPAGTAWVLATSHGVPSANPWIVGDSWVVSAPVWLR